LLTRLGLLPDMPMLGDFVEVGFGDNLEEIGGIAPADLGGAQSSVVQLDVGVDADAIPVEDAGGFDCWLLGGADRTAPRF
jgi:hypothetical protein